MSRYLYSLLVAINDYPDPAHRLNGCVNDMEGWKAYLATYAQQMGHEFKPFILKNETATRQAIITGFTEHLTQARENDLAVFFFAGHGSEMPGQRAFGQAPTERNQTLVCWDSRTPESWDLVDKELSNLVAAVADSNPQITVIMDCCHSGSTTRELPYKERRIEPQFVASRPRDSYFTFGDSFGDSSPDREISESSTQVMGEAAFRLRRGRHILFAACHERETSKETREGDVSRGVFSACMQKILAEATRPMTYAELLKQVRSDIRRQKIPEQVPQLEVIRGMEGDRDCFFLSREQQTESDGVFTLSYQDGWVVDGGGVHGWPEGVEDPGIELAVFPFADTPEDMKRGVGRVAIAHVQIVQNTVSQVRVREKGLDSAQLYKALVTKMPLPDMLTAFLHGNERGVEALRLSLSELDEQLVKVREVAEASAAMVVLKAAEREYEIFRGAALRETMTVPVAVRRYCPPLPTDVGDALVRIWRWLELRALSNEEQSRSVDVEFALFQKSQAQAGTNLYCNCQLQGGRWLAPDIQFQIRNNTTVPIYCAVLYLSPEFGISPDLMEAGGLWVEPGSIGETIDFDLAIPDVFINRGASEYPTVFKLIVSNQQFNARIWYQEELGKTGREIIPKRKNQDFWVTKEITLRCATPNHAAAGAKTEFVIEPVDSEGSDQAAEIAELWAMDEADLLVELGRLAERSPIVTERPIETGEFLVRSPIVTERPMLSNKSYFLKGKQLFDKILNETNQLIPPHLVQLINCKSQDGDARAADELEKVIIESFMLPQRTAAICTVLLVRTLKQE